MAAPRRGRQIGTACQLCDWNDTKRYPGGCVPRAVATVCGVRLCEGHVERLIAVAAAAGVVVRDLVGVAA